MYDTDLGQCIPPTFSSGSSRCFDDSPGRISYRLEATLIPFRGGHLFQRQIIDEVEVHVVVPRAKERVDPRVEQKQFRFETQTLHLNPSTGDGSLSFRGKLHSHLHHDRFPLSVVSINLQVPTDAIITSLVPIRIGVSHDFDAFTSQITPMTPATGRLETPRKTGGDGYEKELAHLPLDGILVSEDLNLSHVDRHSTSDASAHSFQSFDICRDYSMKIKATIECASVKHYLEHLMHELTLLSVVPPLTPETVGLAADSYSPAEGASFKGGAPPSFDTARDSSNQSPATIVLPPPQYGTEPQYGNKARYANQVQYGSELHYGNGPHYANQSQYRIEHKYGNEQY
ncbi:hypothetical protein MMC18_005510 [Xylographa bjoerkii]|nr:hypothetical protein [Xylographa bjoerkii]